MKDFSAILLAGGKSSRMGTDKALLPYKGTTLLEWQIRKLQALGIEDIMLSGRREGPAPVRCIEDEFTGRGPLGGLHACLKMSAGPRCLVLGVDMPLVPEVLLRELAIFHLSSEAPVTVLLHAGKWEPLLGVYDSRVSSAAEGILQGGDWSVRRLLKEVGCSAFPYTGDEGIFCNCNTPEDYKRLCQEP